MGLFDSIGDAVFGAFGGKAAAEQNWKYQKEAMQNAHQWEVADLEKAGLNPALSAGGNGASTGGAGGSGSPQGDVFGTVLSMINTATSAMKQITETEQVAAQKELTEAQTELTNTQTLNTAKEGNWIDPKTEKEIEEATSRIAQNKTTSALAEEQTNLIKGGTAAKYVGTQLFESAKKASFNKKPNFTETNIKQNQNIVNKLNKKISNALTFKINKVNKRSESSAMGVRRKR